MDGPKRYENTRISVDTNLFENGAKQFSLENGLYSVNGAKKIRKATATSLDKRFNEQNNGCARAL